MTREQAEQAAEVTLRDGELVTIVARSNGYYSVLTFDDSGLLKSRSEDRFQRALETAKADFRFYR